MYPGLELVWGNFYRFLVKAGLLPIPSTPLVVANLAALKALTTRPDIVFTEGYNTANDGGGGPPWQWVAGSVETVDDFMVTSPTGSPAGRYIRQLQGAANVSPKWGGCGLGAADDSAQFQKILDFGAGIDLSDCTIPVKDLAVGAADAPCMISDGSGVFIPAPGSTSATILFTISRSDFFVENVHFLMPISTDSGVAPACDRALYFRNDSGAQNFRVENCRFTGGTYGAFATTGGSAIENVQFIGNTCTGQWGASLEVDCANRIQINRNTIFNSGYNSTAYAGAIRIGALSQAQPIYAVEICENEITDCGVDLPQEAIDCTTATLTGLLLADNVLLRCGNGGIEIKTAFNGSFTPHTYEGVVVTGNVIQLPETNAGGADNVSIGITLSVTGSASTYTPGDAKKTLVAANNIYRRTTAPSSPGTIYGIAIAGWSYLDIVGNYIAGVNSGIRIGAGVAVTGNAISDIYINGNTIDAVNLAIMTEATTTVTGLYINNNPLLRAVGSGAVVQLGANTASTVVGLEMHGNMIVGTSYGIEMRDVSNGVVNYNRISAGINGVLTQTTAPTNVSFSFNDVTVSGGSANHAFNIGVGTGIVIQRNNINVPSTLRTVVGAGTYVSAGNVRGTSQIKPTLAGSLNDVVLNWSASIGTPKEWVCTTAGVSGTAYWSTNGQLNGLQRVTSYLGGDVALNNTANFFDGPNTGSIGASGQVWQIMAMAQVTDSVAATANFVAQIHDGTNALAGGFVMVPIAGLNGGQIVCSTMVTLSGATTFTLKAKDQTATTGSLVGSAGGGINCTYISAVRLA